MIDSPVSLESSKLSQDSPYSPPHLHNCQIEKCQQLESMLM